VIEQFGLDYESLVDLKPDVIMVRMPGLRPKGAVARLRRLGGEFRTDLGDVGGDGLCRRAAVQSAGPRRPIVGVHAGVALLAALEHRRRTARANSSSGADRGGGVGGRRAGDRVFDERSGPAARGQPATRLSAGVYPTAVDGEWVAISVRDDADWTGSSR
jgi:crotonobetainyl-CoA:carnitine CoA-transferase CaiB-like acyl-CoA transferase